MANEKYCLWKGDVNFFDELYQEKGAVQAVWIHWGNFGICVLKTGH